AHARLKVERAGRGLRDNSGEILWRTGVAAGSGVGARINGDRSVEIPELALRAATEAAVFADARKVVVGADSARRSRLELRCAGNRPSTDRLILLHERNGVDVVHDYDVTAIVFRRSPQIAGVVSIRYDIAVIGSVIHALGERVADAESRTVGEPAF